MQGQTTSQVYKQPIVSTDATNINLFTLTAGNITLGGDNYYLGRKFSLLTLAAGTITYSCVGILTYICSGKYCLHVRQELIQLW